MPVGDAIVVLVDCHGRVTGHFSDLVDVVALVEHLADETAAGGAPGDVVCDSQMGTNFLHRFGDLLVDVSYTVVHLALRPVTPFEHGKQVIH